MWREDPYYNEWCFFTSRDGDTIEARVWDDGQSYKAEDRLSENTEKELVMFIPMEMV